jgi:hypothetical protein
MKRTKLLTFREAYRILRAHRHFNLWQAICYAMWISG